MSERRFCEWCYAEISEDAEPFYDAGEVYCTEEHYELEQEDRAKAEEDDEWWDEQEDDDFFDDDEFDDEVIQDEVLKPTIGGQG